MLKNLFLSLIAVVIPLFFLGLYLSSTWNRLASLRARCRQLRERFQELSRRQDDLSVPIASADSGAKAEFAEVEEELASVREAYHDTARKYELGRSGFPGSFLARRGRFGPLEPSLG